MQLELLFYWLAATSSNDAVSSPSNEFRLEMAMREAQRHAVGPHGYDRALEALKATCAFRKNRKLELFRTLFDKNPQYETHEEKELADKYRAHIQHESSNKRLWSLRGMDKESRAMILVFPRTCPETITSVDLLFLNFQLFMIERAIACTESLSQGKEDQIVVILDFGNLKSSCAPSCKVMKQLIWILQNHYPQRLRNLLITFAPFRMRGIYKVFSPSVDPYTKTKFRMASGDKQKVEAIQVPSLKRTKQCRFCFQKESFLLRWT